MRCSDCRWWDAGAEQASKGEGVCRVRPPVVAIEMYGTGYVSSRRITSWPVTKAKEFCKEFESKE